MQIVITGANRGIGAAMARDYRARGDDVIGTARAGGDVTLDVTSPASCAALADTLAGKPVDLLVCNAGVFDREQQDLDKGYPAEQWATGFATNVTGTFLSIQALLPNLRKAGGKIAIISSQMASDNRAPGGSYVYRASKAASLNLGRNLAQDLRKDGVAVGIYHPGWVRTDMGGDEADISIDDSAAGLLVRFDALSMDTTGCFETWDGRAHPY